MTTTNPATARAPLPLTFMPAIFPLVLIYGFMTWCFLFMTLQFAKPTGEVGADGVPVVTGMGHLADLVQGLTLVNLLFFLLVGANLVDLRLTRSRNAAHWFMAASTLVMLVLLQIAIMRFQQTNGG